MKRTNVVLVASLIACTAAAALAQDSRAKVGNLRALTAQPAKALQVPDTYGTAVVSYYRMGASEFTPLQVPGLDNYSDTYYLDSTTFRRYGPTGKPPASFIGTPHLPSGAKVLTVYVEGCAGGVGTLHGDVNACAASGDLCTVLASYTGASGCGHGTVDLSGAGYVVDNGPDGNLLVIRLVTSNIDGSDSIAGVSVAYQLQVSPAPQSATFPDVPTTDFGFQYVEALVDSGITGGCGGGNYCPDAPVTRRQMAIFIAKALGLQWN